eukprot:GSMAST32.ASY1.ANO1.1258.1 assembled CDS
MNQSSYSAADDTRDKVRVVVRVRPVLHYESDHMVVVRASSSGQSGDVRANRREFAFDRCFGGESTQEYFFDACGVKDLLHAGLNGYCATVFAFGQTGSGKTYTMTVSKKVSKLTIKFDEYSGGLVPRSMKYIFTCINSIPKSNIIVRASYCLLIATCDNLNDVMMLNKDTSRSHSIFTLYIESEGVNSTTGKSSTRFGKLSFIDLAGSEKVKKTKVTGAGLIEATNVNRSLFTLGKIISLLTNVKHIPYRDSKLTKLLMDSLVCFHHEFQICTSKTLMIACASPGDKFISETLSTFYFATRAKNIVNKPMVKLKPKEQFVISLQTEVVELRKENKYLRKQLSIPKRERNIREDLMSQNSGSNSNTNSSNSNGISSKYIQNSRHSRTSTKESYVHDQNQTENTEMKNKYEEEVRKMTEERDEARRFCCTTSAKLHAMEIENEKLQDRLRHVEAVFIDSQIQDRNNI